MISNSLIKSVESLKCNNDSQALVCAEDEELIQEVFQGIKNHIDENYIRKIVYSYVERFVEMALHCPPALIQHLNPCWINRAEGWYQTIAYRNLQKVMKSK